MFTLRLEEMTFSVFSYWLIFGACWIIWKIWIKDGDRKRGMRKILIWSPLFRCLLMTWFATALYEMTFIYGAFSGFKSDNIDLKNPKVKGKGNAYRMLVGLDTRYPTEPELNGF